MPQISNHLLGVKEALLDEHSHYPIKTRTNGWMLIRVLLSTVALGLIALFYFLSTLWIASPGSGCSVNEAAQKTSVYSPFFDDDANLKLHKIRLNGSIYGGDILDTPWAQLTTNPETEAVWDALEYDSIRTIPLTRQQILKMGKDPSKVAKFDNDFWNMGDDAYVGGLDLHHQIHCLNKLRKTILDGVAVDHGSARFHQIHVRHCIDSIMQHILCNGDAGFITYNWFEDMDIPQPDFGVDKQCRDWDQIIRWGEQHTVDRARYAQWAMYHKPADRVELPYMDEIATSPQIEKDINIRPAERAVLPGQYQPLAVLSRKMQREPRTQLVIPVASILNHMDRIHSAELE